MRSSDVRRSARFSATALLLILLGLPAAGRATTINVTTLADKIADDGRCSLREAVTAANTQKRSGTTSGECAAGQPRQIAVDVIRVPAGKLRLTRGGQGEDRNVGGDLDVTDSVVIAGAGRAETVIRNGLGDPATPGDGDRLFHVDPRGIGSVDVTFKNLTLAGGDVGCSGEGCETGASAVEASGTGTLSFRTCRVIQNAATCFGEGCGDTSHGAAIRAAGAGSLIIRKTILRANSASCTDVDCESGGAAIFMSDPRAEAKASSIDNTSRFILEDSNVDGNWSTCTGVSCDTGPVAAVFAGDVAVRASSITNNSTSCEGDDCETGEAVGFAGQRNVTFEDMAFAGNSGVCEGDSCGTGSLLEAFGSNVAAHGLVAERNESLCIGPNCFTAEQTVLFGAPLLLESVAVTESSEDCQGESCGVSGVLTLASFDTISIHDLLVDQVGSACRGDFCQAQHTVSILGRSAAIDESTIRQSHVVAAGDDSETGSLVEINGPEDVVLSAFEMADNLTFCEGLSCTTESVARVSSQTRVRLEQTTLAGNTLACNGDLCQSSVLLGVDSGEEDVDSGGDVAIAGLDVLRNTTACFGASCDVDAIVQVSTANAEIAGMFGQSNVASCEGTACSGQETVSLILDDGTITQSSFVANRSECNGSSCTVGFGGALHNRAKHLSILDSSFTDNRTDGFGAGIFNEATSELLLRNVEVRRNEAGLRVNNAVASGGGIYNDAITGGTRGVLRIANSQITDNKANFAGGGILNEGTIASLITTTITNNTPDNCKNSGGTGCP